MSEIYAFILFKNLNAIKAIESMLFHFKGNKHFRHPLTPHDHPPIGVQDLAAHVAGVIAGEEEKAGGDFIGLAGPPHGGVFAKMLDLLRRGAAKGIERGPDRAGRDTVDPDPLAYQIFRQRPGEGGDCSLGR